MKPILPACLLALAVAGCAVPATPDATAVPPPPPAATAAATTAAAAEPATDNLVKSGRWDVLTAKCGAILAASDDDRAAVGMFYYGYLAAKYNFTVIATDRIESDLRAVFATCKADPALTIVESFRRSVARRRS